MKLYPIITVVTLLAISSPAFAYIDPGMGSLGIQALIAFIAGCGVTVKAYWQKIKGFFSKGKCDDLMNSDQSINQNNIEP